MSDGPKEANFSQLASSLILPCGAEIPNRLCKAAMTEALADDYGRPTPALFRLYEAWSNGGAGLLITGNVQVDRRYVERPGNVCIDGDQDEEQLRLLRGYAVSAKVGGSKVFVQLSHAGRQANGMINLSPVGPGNVRLDLPKAYFGDPTPLSLEDVQNVKQRFVNAARVCQQCGFDGVQIHSAHGYLLSSFLNPLANNRQVIFGSDDPYSGPIEKRSLLLIEIVRDVRKAVGTAFPISVKLNSADFQQGGFTTAEAVEVAKLLDEEGVDLLEISGGNYETGIYEQTVTNFKDNRSESTKRREAYFLNYAMEISQLVKRMPLMVTGGWRTRINMENAIKNNECALIGLGRPLCGDPDGPKKLINRSIDSLPTYERSLRTFAWYLQWLFLLPFKLLASLQFITQQAWYYRNMVSIAETGQPRLEIGCFAAFLENDSHEKRLAANIKGDVNCVGSIYQGPSTQT
jgi:2,4-dienoyl-CoA reductase-like NADH-dependent reductase (Old Yellow Enzyme family)